MVYAKSMNLLEIKKLQVPWYFVEQSFFHRFFDNFLALLLLWKIIVFNIFDIVNFKTQRVKRFSDATDANSRRDWPIAVI